MKMQRLAIGLTLINLMLLVLMLSQQRAMTAPTEATTLRARVLEIVDDRGQVRSRLNVESDGEVVLRLLDQTGTIRVKLGAGKDGSGLVLLDETTEVGVHVLARRNPTAARPNTTGVTMVGAGGMQRVIRP